MLYEDPPPHLDLKIGTKSLSVVSSAKVLGIWLQEDLKWDSQIDHLCKNANKRLFMLRTLKRFSFNPSELITVYRGYIRPIIEYADVIWHSSLTLKQSQTLESIQRRACKMILGFEYVSYVNALEIMWSWSSVCSAWDWLFEFCAFSAKIWAHQNANPPSRQEIHGKQLRNSTNITQLRARTNRFAQSPIPYYIGLLNST